MQVGLQSHPGNDVANILMEHLPPSGWSDIARKQHTTDIHKELTRINGPLQVVIGGVLTKSTVRSDEEF